MAPPRHTAWARPCPAIGVPFLVRARRRLSRRGFLFALRLAGGTDPAPAALLPALSGVYATASRIRRLRAGAAAADAAAPAARRFCVAPQLGPASALRPFKLKAAAAEGTRQRRSKLRGDTGPAGWG